MSLNANTLNIADIVETVNLILSDDKAYEQEKLCYCDKLCQQKEKETIKHLQRRQAYAVEKKHQDKLAEQLQL